MDELIVKKGNNKFYIGENSDTYLAHITYVYEEDNIIVVNSTFVAPELRGKSVAKKLLNEIVNMARTENLKVIPKCTFAVAHLTRNNDFEDILYTK